MKQPRNCQFCQKTLLRHPCKTGRYFCNTQCKADWQKLARPVSVEWLRQKYEVKKLDCTQIGALVHRDPKSVWNWLQGSGIVTRRRGMNPRVHFVKGAVSLFQGRRHSATTRKLLSEQKKKAGACPALINGRHWLHVYPDRKSAAWRGGISPERQAFYASREWKSVAREVWARDKKTCQRCQKKFIKGDSFDIHHIASFQYRELRATATNLILLCEKCHHWIHSKLNQDRILIRTL